MSHLDKLILYSTGCPKCNVLKKKMDSKNIEYTECNSIPEMEKLNISSVPVLMVNGELMMFKEAGELNVNKLENE